MKSFTKKRIRIAAAALLLVMSGVVLSFAYVHRVPTADCRSIDGFYTPPDGLAELVDAPVIVTAQHLPNDNSDVMDVTNSVRIDTVLKGHGVKPGDIIEMCPFAGPALPEEGQTEAVLLFLAGRDQGRWSPFYGRSGIAPGLSDNTYDVVEGYGIKPVSLDEVRAQLQATRRN